MDVLNEFLIKMTNKLLNINCLDMCQVERIHKLLIQE